MSLLAEERKNVILEIINANGKVKVNALVKKFNVSSETIRRDLDALEDENKLKKVYGGAIKISSAGVEPPYIKRFSKNELEKQLIGKKAADLVEDRDTIIIDVGSTAFNMVPFICEKKEITVITNSIPAMNLLIESKNNNRFHGKIIFIGGEINAEQMTVSGPISEKVMENLYVDKAFIAVGGMTLIQGITSYNTLEASLSERIIKKAKQVFVMADSSKIGAINLYKVSEIDVVDGIISDIDVPKEWKKILKEKNIHWITASK